MSQKYYITKYVLTRGILKVDCELSNDKKYVFGVGNKFYRISAVVGKDAFTDEVEAQSKARSMLRSKLYSLENQRDKLAKMLVCLGGIAP